MQVVSNSEAQGVAQDNKNLNEDAKEGKPVRALMNEDREGQSRNANISSSECVFPSKYLDCLYKFNKILIWLK
jgi:hypothetical protein